MEEEVRTCLTSMIKTQPTKKLLTAEGTHPQPSTLPHHKNRECEFDSEADRKESQRQNRRISVLLRFTLQGNIGWDESNGSPKRTQYQTAKKRQGSMGQDAMVSCRAASNPSSNHVQKYTQADPPLSPATPSMEKWDSTCPAEVASCQVVQITL